MSLEGDELQQFINSTNNQSIDYHSDTKLSEEEAIKYIKILKKISEFPRRYNQCCIIGTCDTYYQSLIMFPCCGYNHGACETCLKDYFTSIGVTCPMCRSNMMENIPVLQPQKRLNLDFGLSPNEETHFFQNKKHAEIGHYTGHEVLINNSNATVSFKKATFCMKVNIPKKNKSNPSENRKELVFYKNINLKTQKKFMEFVIWYQERYTNNKFDNEDILWNLICKMTYKFKEISTLLKKEFQTKNYIKLYDNFIDSLYNLSKEYLKTNNNNNNVNNVNEINLPYYNLLS
jgi:hypothetical protein